MDDLVKRHSEIERQKLGARQQINFHRNNVILQGTVSFLLAIAGIYYSQKKDPMLPFVIVPSTTASIKKLESSRKKHQHYKQMLNNLEKG